MKGETLSSVEFVSQELVMLDFDNKDRNNTYTIEDLENDMFMQEHACFYYRTFSDSTSKVDKFRVVFQLDRLITNADDIKKVYNYLYNKYPQADTCVGQTNRMFFGGNQSYVTIDFENTLNTESLEFMSCIKHSTNSTNEILDTTTPNYVLLKYGKIELVKEKLGNIYSNEFSDEVSALNYFSSLDMTEILELPVESPFHDILHEEDNPSASVFYSKKTNVFLYKCFSESNKFTGNIAVLLAKYLKLPSRLDAIELLLDITNSKVNYDSELGKARKLSNIFRKDLISGKLAETNPDLYQVLKRYKVEINATLDFMYDYTYLDGKTNEIKYLNYFSVETLRQMVSRATGQQISNTKMWNILNVIIVTEIISKIPRNEIPASLIEKIVVKQENLSEQVRVSNFYEPNFLDDLAIERMTQIASDLIENDVNVSSLSYQLIYRLYGEERANKYFPQAYKPLEDKGLIIMSKEDSNLTSKNIKLENAVIQIITEEIKEKGYIFEDELYIKLSRKLRTKKDTVKRQYYKLRADIMNKYDFKRSRLNKELYSKLDVKESFSTKVIIYKSDSL